MNRSQLLFFRLIGPFELFLFLFNTWNPISSVCWKFFKISTISLKFSNQLHFYSSNFYSCSSFPSKWLITLFLPFTDNCVLMRGIVRLKIWKWLKTQKIAKLFFLNLEAFCFIKCSKLVRSCFELDFLNFGSLYRKSVYFWKAKNC